MGSSLAAADIAQILDVKTLFIVRTMGLLDQPWKALAKCFAKEIGVIGDTEWNPQAITIAMIQTLGN